MTQNTNRPSQFTHLQILTFLKTQFSLQVPHYIYTHSAHIIYKFGNTFEFIQVQDIIFLEICRRRYIHHAINYIARLRNFRLDHVIPMEVYCHDFLTMELLFKKIQSSTSTTVDWIVVMYFKYKSCNIYCIIKCKFVN